MATLTKKFQIDGKDVDKLEFKIGIYDVYREKSKHSRDAVLHLAAGDVLITTVKIEPNYECEGSWVGEISVTPNV